MWQKIWVVCVVATVAAIARAASVRAPVAPQPSAPSQTANDEIERKADQLFAAGMTEHRVPGGVLVLVRNGIVVLAKGYGFADPQRRIPVTPDTVFRVGSVSKPVTATAAMLLVERGRLSLDDDVRPLLPEVAESGVLRSPVSLAQLLTHTAGLDVTNVGDASATPEKLLPLEQFIAHHLPPQVFAPGQVYHYSNQGYAVVGRLIERASGQPFASFVNREVLAPLGMAHSTFEQPAPDALRATQSTGYELRDGALIPLPMDFSQVAPADALLATGADMGRFITAQLGRIPLLAPETRAVMHATRFTYHQGLPGVALGFDEELIGARRGTIGTRRLLVHTGGQLGFTSELGMVPEIDAGWFIALNRRVGRMRQVVIEELLSEMLPPSVERSPANSGADQPPPAVAHGAAGTYVSLSAPRSTVERIVSLLDPSARVQVELDRDQEIVVSGLGRLRPAAHGVFESEDGSRLAAFDTSNARLFVDQAVFERVRWYRDPAVHRTTAFVSLCVMVVTLVAWPLGRRGRWRGAERPLPTVARVAGFAVLIAHGSLVLFTIGLAVELARVSGAGWNYGFPFLTRVLLAIPAVAAATTVVSAACAALLWWKRLWPVQWRVAYSAAVATATVYLAILAQWNALYP